MILQEKFHLHPNSSPIKQVLEGSRCFILVPVDYR